MCASLFIQKEQMAKAGELSFETCLLWLYYTANKCMHVAKMIHSCAYTLCVFHTNTIPFNVSEQESNSDNFEALLNVIRQTWIKFPINIQV